MFCLSDKVFIRYPTHGVCIYCGRADIPLSDEHVVPFGLSGAIILPKASCLSCARITGPLVEGAALRGALFHLRNKYKLPTRRPKERPDRFKLKIYSNDKSFRYAYLPTSELPFASWALPDFGWPSFLTNRPPDEGARLRCSFSVADVQNLSIYSHDGNPVGFQVALNVDLFARMIVKIAYSYLAGEVGVDNASADLRSVVLGNRTIYRDIVGTVEPCEPPRQYLYEIEPITYITPLGIELACVKIRLFSYLGTPTYIVVAGSEKRLKFSVREPRAYAHPSNVDVRYMAGERVSVLDLARYDAVLADRKIGSVTTAEMIAVMDLKNWRKFIRDNEKLVTQKWSLLDF
jgi:hypothetical protein